MKRILFCYFSPIGYDYTPLDIGYILSLLKEKTRTEDYSFKIVPLSWGKEEGTGYDPIFEDIDRISFCHPDAVFIFLENIIWSKVFAINRVKPLALMLKSRLPHAFVGVQGYRITKEHVAELFSLGAVDCVVASDPENSFCELEKILQNEPVFGVIRRNEPKGSDEGRFTGGSVSENTKNSDLDRISSPYLSHVLDDFLAEKQEMRDGNFKAFLYSSRGCQFGCYYCSRSVKFERVCFFSTKRFYDELEYLFSKFKISRFFVLDDAFLFSKERLALFFEEFKKRKISNPELESISIYAMARPESLDEGSIFLLKGINIRWIQIGLQTVKPDIAHFMNRDIPIDDFRNIALSLKEAGIKIHLDIISGLPFDSLEYFKRTLDFAISLEPTRIQVKQFYLNPGTRFYFDRKKYAIEIEKTERDLHVPYVVSAAGGVDGNYHRQVDQYIEKKTKKNSSIGWRIATKSRLWTSKNYKLEM